MQDPQEDAPSNLVENEEVIPQAPRDNGSNLLDHGLGQMEKDLQDYQLHNGKLEAIPHWRFEIEGGLHDCSE